MACWLGQPGPHIVGETEAACEVCVCRLDDHKPVPTPKNQRCPGLGVSTEMLVRPELTSLANLAEG